MAMTEHNTSSEAQAPRTLLSTIVGSRAHGTSTPTSDWDIRNVFLQPTRTILTLGGYEKFIENPQADENSWELFHFLRLTLRNNPFTLEALAATPQMSTPEGDELRSLFPQFLSKFKVRGAFLGFATGQKKKMLSPETNYNRTPKAMAHYLRVLYNGIELLRTATMTVRIIDTAIGPQVLAAKRGEMECEEVLSIGERLEREMEEAFLTSEIPDDADLGPINEFHLRLRKLNW
jgi:predicted nucleotidyltransferase